MIKLAKTCKVCKTIKAQGTDGKLARRIYNSKQFIRGGEPLQAIADSYVGDFTYQSLFNHVKVHQNLNEEELTERKLDKIDRQVAAKQRRHYREAHQAIIDKGLEQLESGEMKVTATHLIQAANKTADIELKKADQNLSFMGMIAAFASKEITRTDKNVIEGDTSPAPDSYIEG